MNTATYARPAVGVPPMKMPPYREPVNQYPTSPKATTQTKDCGLHPAEKEITMKDNNKVYICSPFRPVGETVEAQAKSIKKHKILARYACRYAVANGYSPLCPHLYYPEFLDDNVEDEREIGMLLGMVGLSECEELWIVGRRISEGMSRSSVMRQSPSRETSSKTSTKASGSATTTPSLTRTWPLYQCCVSGAAALRSRSTASSAHLP